MLSAYCIYTCKCVTLALDGVYRFAVLEELVELRSSPCYSRLGSLVAQDLVSTVQGALIPVSLQTLKSNESQSHCVLRSTQPPRVALSSPAPLTCILVLMTSRGVFPKTLAAPAVAPNAAVTKGFISLWGSSPGRTEHTASYLCA